MNLTLTLTDEQMATLADAVAKRLGRVETKRAAHTVTETATLLGCSRDTVERRIKAGVIPTVPGMGRVLVPARYFETL